MPLVILENRTRRPRRMLTLNLPRELAPVRSRVQTRVEAKDGTRRLKVVDRNIGDSMRIPHGCVSQPFDEKLLHAPEIRKVVRAREVRVIREDDPRWKKALELADPKRARDRARAAEKKRVENLKAANAKRAAEEAAKGPKTRTRKTKPAAEAVTE